jgi:DNA polymerase-1
MWVDRDRARTQAPALYGQSGTREIVDDALIRMPDEVLTMLVAQVHDALVFSIPKDRADEIAATIRGCMETDWQPKAGGQRIHFPVGQGPYAENWQEASHG